MALELLDISKQAAMFRMLINQPITVVLLAENHDVVEV